MAIFSFATHRVITNFYLHLSFFTLLFTLRLIDFRYCQSLSASFCGPYPILPLSPPPLRCRRHLLLCRLGAIGKVQECGRSYGGLDVHRDAAGRGTVSLVRCCFFYNGQTLLNRFHHKNKEIVDQVTCLLFWFSIK